MASISRRALLGCSALALLLGCSDAEWKEIEGALDEVAAELEATPTPPAPPSAEASGDCVSMAGRWALVDEIDASGCEEEDSRLELIATVSQEGCQARFDLGGVELDGTVTGNEVQLQGRYFDPTAMGTIGKDLRLVLSGNRLEGGGSWTWGLGEAVVCTGGSQITGQRL